MSKNPFSRLPGTNPEHRGLETIDPTPRHLDADLLALLSEQSRDDDPLETALTLTRHAAAADLLVVVRTVDANAIECIRSSPNDPVCHLLTARSVCESVLASGRPEFVEDYAHYQPRSRILTHWGARSAALLPLLTPDFEAAVLLFWKQSIVFDETLRRVLTSMIAYFRAVLPYQEVSRRLASAQARLSSILETIPQGVILVDSASAEAWLNAAAASILNLAPGSISPLAVSGAMADLDSRARRQQLSGSSRPSLPGVTSEWFWAFGDPTERVLEVLTRTLQGSFTGQLWVLTDVTQTFLQSQALLRQSEQMALVNRELMETKQDLEQRVEQRTSELADAVNRLTQNAAEQIRLQHELLRFNTDLQASNLALRESEEALRLSEQRLLVALEASNLGVFESSPVTRQGRWDARCRAAFGIPPDTPVTLDTLLERVHPDDRAHVEAALVSSLDPLGDGRYCTEYRTVGQSDAILRYVHAEGVAHRSGGYARIIGTIQDISVRKRAEESLLRAISDLREFAYAAAHDLQEPLRNIANALGLLDRKLRGLLEPDTAVLVRESISSARRMHDMVKDLLLFTRISDTESRTADLTDANPVLNRVIENLSGVLSETGGLIVGPGLPKVRIDPVHLLQLFQNLIGNALKYRHPDRAPLVQVGASVESGECSFSVEDNGIGFDPQYAERIFGVFKRLHGRDEYPGNGIGLAICARIVASYGGRIWAESQLGTGSTFRFTLPL